MVRIGGIYNPEAGYSANVGKSGAKGRSAVGQRAGSQKADGAASSSQARASGLSERAQAYLDKLNQSYGNMEFLVVDPGKGDAAKEAMARGTKEYSVLLTSEELEKMASDEKFEQKYMHYIQSAIRMSEQINREFGFESVFGKGESVLTKVAFSFHEDGSMTIFASLEESGEAQRERLERAREKKATQDRREDREEGRRDARAKRAVVEADSLEDLRKKISELDWDAVRRDRYDGREESGARLDLSV